jgi:alkylation response protein AidB-like acyl-CoA dehydrogenase
LVSPCCAHQASRALTVGIGEHRIELGLDVGFTEEQEQFRAACRELLARHCPPSVVRAVATPDGVGHSDTLWHKIAEAGWLGLPFSEEDGGLGATLLDLGIAWLEAGRSLVPTTLYSTVHAALLIARLGTPEQKRAWLSRIFAGEVIATVAVAEASAINEVRYMAATATPVAAGWAVRAAKLFVRNGQRADLVLLLVLEAPRGVPDRPLLFLLEPGDYDTRPHHTAGHDAQCSLVVDAVLAADRVLGGDPAPDRTHAEWAHVQLAVTALQCLEMAGGARALAETTAAYVNQRVVFGRPLATFQAVQHLLADVLIKVKGAELASWQALWRIQEGLPAEREVAVAKVWAGRTYKQASVVAHELHAGAGYVMEADLHFWSDRATAADVQNGSSSHHLRRVAEAIGRN